MAGSGVGRLKPNREKTRERVFLGGIIAAGVPAVNGGPKTAAREGP
jgi:hypothetical protein